MNKCIKLQKYRCNISLGSEGIFLINESILLGRIDSLAGLESRVEAGAKSKNEESPSVAVPREGKHNEKLDDTCSTV